MADKSQKIIVVMLVLAILFSVASIYMSWTSLNFDLPKKQAQVFGGSQAGNVILGVEGQGSIQGANG